MQIQNTRTDEKNWIRCGQCGHKLMRLVQEGSSDVPPMVEIKCHSCKTINVWTVDKYKLPF